MPVHNTLSFRAATPTSGTTLRPMWGVRTSEALASCYGNATRGQSGRMRMRLPITLLLLLCSCRGAEGKQEAKPTETPPSKPEIKQDVPAGSATKPGAKDVVKGDQQDSEWVPAEFKSGAARWKDVGVYLDGKPISFLTFGELPITLKPIWLKVKRD